ncbi:fimbrillin family protein [Prevotella copri]|uniref:Fimbrillin family protein n=1 Tax=Segatella copri TaxID=165179 RepID=A0A5P0VJI2_9BACT|nr:fimbrillin family protein [Segatella copri]MQM58407.1 fimbrillin family protein [Segatella copri]MQN06533.1 fimbrillin family protein [Segatella copri]MQN08457.1 fimbrillin family protein [Segatella copri]MQN42488.1 fimbrillin family protein [Segatella copri]MQN50276.1 fimbrillin family protein [Segatella copri]
MNLNYHKMKFLRLAFYVLVAQLVLSGCAGEAVEETSSSSASEINFDAYVGRDASTRSDVTDIDFLKSGEWNAGFGVFARYGNTHLMDTEHVTWRKDHWGYDHIRFWPSSGKVDFYAFAPYSEQVKMGGLPDSLVNQADSNSPNTYIDFPSNWSPIDLIWSKQPDQTAPTSPDSKVTFQFKHALARLSFDITAPNLEDGTVIKVQRVRLYGVSDFKGVFVMEGYLNLNTGAWILADNGVKWHYTWTPEGKKADIPNNDNGKKDSIVYKLSDPPELPNLKNKVTNDGDSYIFIIPQTKTEPFHLAITYTVQQGDFKETVTVKKNLLDVLDKSGAPNPSFTFEKGKAYVFHLKLSLDPVDFSVTVDGKKRDEVTGEITI